MIKKFKNFLTEEVTTGQVIHITWNNSIKGEAKILVPASEFKKDPDLSSLKILKNKDHRVKSLTRMEVDKKPVTHTDIKGTRKYILVHVDFSTKTRNEIGEAADNQVTASEKTKERHEREKEQLKKKQELEKQRAREIDFRAKETKRKLDLQRKEAERRNKQVNEYLEDATDELVAAYKKATPGQND